MKQSKNKLRDTVNRMVVTRGKRGQEKEELAKFVKGSKIYDNRRKLNFQWYARNKVYRYQIIKQLNVLLSYDPATALLGIYPRQMKTYFHT